MKIALRFHLVEMKMSFQWFSILLKIQRHLNNVVTITIDKTSNEIVYDFTSIQTLDLMKSFAKNLFIDETTCRTRMIVTNFIAFAQMIVKFHYDNKHHSLFLKVDDYALLRLHRDYNISFTKRVDFKLSQQYVDSFRVIKKVENLVYRLDLSSYWRVHSIFTIAQLKSSSSSKFDSYNRERFNHSTFVFVEDDFKRVKLYEIERLINKREIARDDEYLLRWKEYDLEWNEWRNLSKLENVMNLIKKYESIMQEVLFLSKRIRKQSILSKAFYQSSK